MEGPGVLDAVERWPDSVSVGEGTKRVTVTAPDERVRAWVRGYLSPWWAVDRGVPGDRSVYATAAPETFAALAEAALSAPHETVAYPRARTVVARTDGTAVAVTPADGVAFRYHVAAGHMEVVAAGAEVLPLARAATRVARELVRAQLVEAGWTLLHASAVVMPGGRAVLSLGGRGAGKTTVALTLASAGGALLGNDRVFARATQAGPGVEVLAWPSGAAVGVGRLAALGWARAAGARLAAGAAPHPAQHGRVTEALRAGRPVRLTENGRELKAHIRPEEFDEWYGVETAGWARAAMVLFPEIADGTVPRLIRGRKAQVEEEHFMAGATEDSYPDIFGMMGGASAGTASARAELADAIGVLPRHPVALGHDIDANSAFLTGLTARAAA
jgi:hypothetical protein